MIIIGEKINGAIPSVMRAIEQRDEQAIRDLALRQTEAGAQYLDVCANTPPQTETETLRWLVDVVQAAVDTPLCLDSPDAKTLTAVLPYARRPGFLNSVNGESSRCGVLFSAVAGTDWQIIAQTTDENGIPPEADGRIAITDRILESAAKYSVAPGRIHIDPLVTAISADNRSVLHFAQTAAGVKSRHPGVKVTAAVSNISFGMPMRRFINQQFLSLAMYMGLDSAVLDPCDRELRAAMLSAEALLGRDRLCRNFLTSYRKKQIGPLRAEEK